MLSLPAFDRLAAARSVLLVGAGGGYDLMGAVPLAVALRDRGISTHLAGVSFTALAALDGVSADPEHACLFPVTGRAATPAAYCPEAWLARWFEETGDARTIWGLAKVGVRPLRAALHALVARTQADLVVLVDGGIDLALRGDETAIGTSAEDLATLAAAHEIGRPLLVMCLGFGTELREGIPHAQVLERFAELRRLGGYLGAITLDPQSAPGRAYRAALEFVAAGQRNQKGSHVHRVVDAALRGEFGALAPDVWVSPLAEVCWFLDGQVLAASHLFLRHLEGTETIWDVTTVVRGCRKALEPRPRTDIPL